MSRQQDRYLAARARGRSMHGACVEADFPLSEARLIENAIARGEIELPSAAASDVTTSEPQTSANSAPDSAAASTTPAAGQAASQQEPDMARRPSSKRAEESRETVEEQKPDFARAKSIYLAGIKPAAGKVGEYAQEMSTAYKELKKLCHVHPGAAKLVFRLDDMEESKRDDWLRTFKGLCRELNIFMPSDLVDAAEGNADGDREVVGTAPRAGPKLATMGGASIGDDDLNGGEHEESAVDRAARAAAE